MLRMAMTVASALLLAAAAGAAPAAEPGVGSPAPGFSLPSLSGDTVSLADQRGKIVVLHFGAGW